jgi:inner membrane protein
MALASLLALIVNINVQLYPLLIFIASLSATIPDLDLKRKHRALLHNVNAMLFFTLIFSLFWSKLGLPYEDVAVTSFLIGYLSHILLDMLTIKGVALFYPFKRKYYRIMRVKSDDTLANTVITIASSVILLITVAYMIV